MFAGSLFTSSIVPFVAFEVVQIGLENLPGYYSHCFSKNFRVWLLPVSRGNLLLLLNVSSSLMLDSALIRWWMCAHVNKHRQMNRSSALNHKLIVCIQPDPLPSHTCSSWELQELSWHPGLHRETLIVMRILATRLIQFFLSNWQKNNDHSGEPGIVEYLTLSLPHDFSWGKKCSLEHKRVAHSLLYQMLALSVWLAGFETT